MGKIIMVCPKCRGENVWKDANARWDYNQQGWDLNATFDNEYCDDCDTEVTLERVEDLDRDEPEPLLPDQPIAVHMDFTENVSVKDMTRFLDEITEIKDEPKGWVDVYPCKIHEKDGTISEAVSFDTHDLGGFVISKGTLEQERSAFIALARGWGMSERDAGGLWDANQGSKKP